MPVIELLPAKIRLEAPAGSELLEAIRRAGIDLELHCGGGGTCGRCLVRVVDGEVGSDSRGRLPEPALAAGYVLACTARLGETAVTVEIPARLPTDQLQAADAEAWRLVGPALLPQASELEPLVFRHALRVPPPQLGDGLSDLDRLTRAMTEELEPGKATSSLSGLRNLAGALRDYNGEVTVTARRRGGELEILDIDPEDRTGRHFGIAVDLGTTSVAVQLVDLVRGAVLATRSDYNSQISCGGDVISRINYAGRPGRLEELRSRAVETVNRLVCEVAAGCGVSPAEIHSAVVSGNTVMTHLLLGLDPEHIRLEPYTPTVLSIGALAAAELELGIAPAAPVRLSPCVGSYVGGDITAGLLCSDLAAGGDEVNLFVDIGTNGEIVVGSAEFLLACACSAGPAFEGGGIDCGMRASPGAIERVAVDPATARSTVSTIGDAPPLGICGSGMIDLVANLLRTGFVDRRGALDRSRRSPFITTRGRRAGYTVVPAEASAAGREIFISEAEIESIIRAKAAVYSASSLMLEMVGLSFADVRTFFIAGSFGRFLDLEQATLIGMIPDLPRERFRYLGNASLMGSTMALLSETHRQRQQELARRMTNIELSAEPSYMDHYTAALFLPHTDLARFPSVAATLCRRGAGYQP